MGEARLEERLRRFRAEVSSLRKPLIEDVFERVLLFSPEDFEVVNYSRRTPLAAFNPGALLVGEELYIFPRMIFDYYKYVSSVALTKVKLAEILEDRVKRPLRSKIILWPRYIWEFLGTEDPRAHLVNDEVYILYTGKGYYLEEGLTKRRDVLGLAKADLEGRVGKRLFLKIRGSEGEYLTYSNKDSTFLRFSGERATMLTRPDVRGLRVCWRAEVSLRERVILEDSLTPVMGFEGWELKVGWSTNAVRVSGNEFLVGWHGVVKEDLSYRNGLALVDEQGDLLAISNYLLSPRGLVEEYGDRPHVIFGDGLVLHDDTLIWVGGVSDYAIGIFTTPLQKALDKLKWVRG